MGASNAGSSVANVWGHGSCWGTRRQANGSTRRWSTMPTHSTVQSARCGVGSKTSTTSWPAQRRSRIGSNGRHIVSTVTCGLASKRRKRRSVLGTRTPSGSAAATWWSRTVPAQIMPTAKMASPRTRVTRAAGSTASTC